MERRIFSVIFRLRLLFWAAWVVVLCVFFMNLAGFWGDGLCVGGSLVYLLNNLVIVLSVAVIPLVLGLFSFGGVASMRCLSLPVALRRYFAWSSLRLSLCGLVAVFDMVVFVAGCGSSGALCSLMVLLSMLIVYPRRKSLESYLDISGERSGYDAQ